MARPRQFDETAVLDLAVACFWARGFEATSVRDLIERTGLTGASLYNAFGDKRALYRKALDHYVEHTIAERIRRCEALPPREAIAAFLAEVLDRSLSDPDHKGCMLVNAALDALPDEPELRQAVAGMLRRIELFFRASVAAGQADGSISQARSAEELGRHLLGMLMGLRVLARARPERALLEGMVASTLGLLDPAAGPG